jgi:hypothetical protein
MPYCVFGAGTFTEGLVGVVTLESAILRRMSTLCAQSIGEWAPCVLNLLNLLVNADRFER